MRLPFGGTSADAAYSKFVNGSRVYLTAPVDANGRSAPVTLTFYDAETGGNQITDLSLDAAGTQPVSSVTIPAGSVQVPSFYGPDGVTELWAEDGDGNRALMVTRLSNAPTDTQVAALVPASSGSETAGALSATYANKDLLRPLPYRKRPRLTMIETFQAGSQWAAKSGTWTADTTDYALGTGSKYNIGNGTGSANAIWKANLPPLDTTNKNFALLVKVDDPTNLYEIQVYFGTNLLANYRVALAARGGASANSTLPKNRWTWIHFPGSDLANPVGTPDMTAITDFQVRVVQANTGVPVKFWVQAIAHYPAQTLYPNGVVSIAFDDNYQDALTNGVPKLDSLGWGATAFTIVEAVTSGTVGFATFDTMQKLEQTHGWEIAGHAYTFAAHGAGFSTLSPAALEDELGNLRQWLKTNGCKGADLFAYPLGDDNNEVVQSVGNYFTIGRQIVRVPLQPLTLDQPLRMRSYSVSSSDSLATLQAAVDKAYASRTWLVFTFHHIVTGTPAAGTEWSAANFASLMDYIATKGMPVKTVGEVLDSTRSAV